MLSTLPYNTYEQIPSGVEQYLRDTGWVTNHSNNRMYFSRTDGMPGYCTWEQACVYNLVKPFLV